MSKVNTQIEISIVIPAFNEAANLAATLQEIQSYLQNRKLTYEVIVVDDGSQDATCAIASSSAGLFENFTLIKNEVNRGKGYSVKKGILSAKGEVILFMDADNSTRIDQLDKLTAAIKEGSDITMGSRRIKGASIIGSQPAFRIILGNIYILFSQLLLGVPAKDFNCGFKLFTYHASRQLFPILTRPDWSFDSELIFLSKKLGLKFKEVPIVWTDKRNTSKVKPLEDGIKSLWALFRIRFHRYRLPYPPFAEEKS